MSRQYSISHHRRAPTVVPPSRLYNRSQTRHHDAEPASRSRSQVQHTSPPQVSREQQQQQSRQSPPRSSAPQVQQPRQYHHQNERQHAYVCYVLSGDNGTKSYVGSTNNLYRRLRQHNGEIHGGARYTRGGRPWILAAFVKGFTCQSEALSFEWYMHHRRPRPSLERMNSVERRVESARKLMQHHKFKDWPLVVHRYPYQY